MSEKTLPIHEKEDTPPLWWKLKSSNSMFLFKGSWWWKQPGCKPGAASFNNSYNGFLFRQERGRAVSFSIFHIWNKPNESFILQNTLWVIRENASSMKIGWALYILYCLSLANLSQPCGLCLGLFIIKEILETLLVFLEFWIGQSFCLW